MKIKAGNDERVWLFFRNIILIGGLLLILCPLWMVLINSFKNKVFINKEPFKLPTKQTWVGIDNFLSAIDKYELLSAVGWTVFI